MVLPHLDVSFGSAVRYERKVDSIRARGNAHHAFSATVPVELPPAATRFTVERGKEYFALTQRVEVVSEDWKCNCHSAAGSTWPRAAGTPVTRTIIATRPSCPM
jgi:hypothetical protein